MEGVRVWRSVVAAAAFVLLAMASPACHDEDGDCPNLTGTWTVLDHCEASAIGTSSVITQTGCGFSAIWGGTTPSSGTVSSNGAVAINVDTSDDILHCTGMVVGDTLTVDCTPGGCHVVSRLAGGGGQSGTTLCYNDSECAGVDECEHVTSTERGACINHCTIDADCGSGAACLVGESMGLDPSCFPLCSGSCNAGFTCFEYDPGRTACLPTEWLSSP